MKEKTFLGKEFEIDFGFCKLKVHKKSLGYKFSSGFIRSLNTTKHENGKRI